jgi:beta-galactosidase
LLTDQLQEKVLLDALQAAAVIGPNQTLPASVRARHGENLGGKTVDYCRNYSSDARTFCYPNGSGTDLLAQAAVAHSQQITVRPWDLAIIEER